MNPQTLTSAPIMSERLRKALDFSQPMQARQEATVAPPSPAAPGSLEATLLSPSVYEQSTAPPAYLSALTGNFSSNFQTSPTMVQAPVAAKSTPSLKLPSGYRSLERLGSQLAKRDPRFSLDTADGRSAQALALAIGGTEVYSRGSSATDFFDRMGGSGNRMKGFAQFDQAYHRGKTSNPSRYTRFVGDILTGKASMPNGRRGSNHARALSQAVESGQVRNGKDLVRFMKQRGFGGSNWEGIDHGQGRVPGLADGLVRFLRNSGS